MYVTKLDPALSNKLRQDLQDQGFELGKPEHTVFQGKKKGLTVTLYHSGKLVVQGKESPDFIEFYLEPELLQELTFTNAHSAHDEKPRIGVDEAGKGDFFGPLCIAGVYGGKEEIEKLLKIGVTDSKKLLDSAIKKMARQIKQEVPHHIVRINPIKYNEIYPKFGNLNLMLAWGHATVIAALSEETGCTSALIDQFSAQPHVLNALKKKGLRIDLEQRTKAESDPIVAAASILARDAFVSGIDKISEDCHILLPKGASDKVLQCGKNIYRSRGIEIFDTIAKKHFKTMTQILDSVGT